MRALKTCLWITGVFFLLSIIGLFMPFSVWQSLAKFFGVEPFPDSPLLVYLIRAMSATYVGVGVFYIILASNPDKYRKLVLFSGIALVLLGLVCVISGQMLDLPAKWFLSDSLSCIILGFLIIVFWQKGSKAG